MKNIFYGLVALSLFAACGNDEMPETPSSDTMTGKPVVVSAGVDGQTSRAGMTTGDLTTLGLTIVNPNSAEYSYSNVRYEKNGSTFSAAGETTPVWQNRTQEVQVTAYAPYSENWTGEQTFAVQTDQGTADAARASDLLWAQNVVSPSGETQTGDIFCNRQGRLVINFQHRMSKLVVNLRYLDEVAEDVSAQSLTVKYLSTVCTVNAGTGAISGLSTPADILAYKETRAAEGYRDCFEAIFPPQNTAFKLELLLDNGQDFGYYSSALDFQSDIAYTFNLAVGKDKVVLDEMTVKRWDEVVGGELETDDVVN